MDAFAVYCPRTGDAYLIPIEDLPTEEATLRIDPPRNGQRKLVRFAADYRIASIDATFGPRRGRAA